MLKSRFIQFMALLISLSFFVGGNALADNGYGKQKVVYHINYDDPKKQAGGLKNIQNHINAVGAENLDIKVVLHGHGLCVLACEQLECFHCLARQHRKSIGGGDAKRQCLRHRW